MGDGNFAHCTAVTIYLFSLFSFTFSSCPFSEQTYSSCLSHAELFLTFQCHSLRAGQVLLWACSPRHIPSKYNLPSLSPRGLQGRIVFPFSFFSSFFLSSSFFPSHIKSFTNRHQFVGSYFHGTSGDAKNYRFWNFMQGFYSVILEWGLGAQECQPQHVSMYWEHADVQHPCIPPGVSIGE